MKKIAFLFAALVAAMTVSAQVRVTEPNLVGTYGVLTSDSTFEVLPMESGTMTEHQTKTSRFLDKFGKVADVVGAVGGVGAVIGADASSIGTVMTGIKVAGTAGSVGNLAGTVNNLTSTYGFDIKFDGPSSSYKIKKSNNDLLLIASNDSNDVNPMVIYRIVRFSGNKKERRMQWLEFKPSVLGESKAEKAGYVGFTGEKYGERSYLLRVPAKEAKKGEYGIIYMNLATATAIPIATFCIE